MKHAVLYALLLPAGTLATEFLVGVGKDETTGKKGMGFDPSVIVPTTEDVIVFEFRSGQHSVVQSSFENPCTGTEGGFNTGVQSVDNSLSVDAPGLPQIRLHVNDSQPLWFFDEAGGLCNKGAVLAVNPTADQTAAAFKQNAANAPPPPSSSSSSSSASGDASGSGSPNASGTQTTDDTPSPSGAASKVVAGLTLFGTMFAVVLGMF